MNYCLALVVLWGLSTLASAAVYDRVLSTAAQRLIKEDDLYFSFRDIYPPKRKPNLAQHVLLSIALPEHHRLAFLLDRKQGQFVLETTIAGDVQRQGLDSKEIRPFSIIDTIMVELSQKHNVASIYINCRLVGTITLSKSPRDMASSLSDVRVYRARNVDVSIDWASDIFELLAKLGCRNEVNTKDFQAQANEIYTYRRGDIPVLHEDEQASILVKSLGALVETIRELQTEIQTQREETVILREAIINCEACKPGRSNKFY